MREATTPRVASNGDALVVAALGWLARLPLLTEGQLGRLLDRDEWVMRNLLRTLHEQGIVASVLVDSPEFPTALRLYHRADAVPVTPTIAEAAPEIVGLDHPPTGIAGSVPAAWAELLAHLTRVETAVGVADTVAMLADDLRRPDQTGRGAGITLDDAGSTAWGARHGRPVLWPPLVEAWVRLRAGGRCATVLLVWDRAGAPRAHRRARVAAWYRADERRDAPWGAMLPPLLVICPNEDAADQWTGLLDRSAARRGRDVLRTAITTLPAVRTGGPLGRIWRRPGGARIDLLDLCAWQDTASPPAGRHPATDPIRPPWQPVRPAVRSVTVIPPRARRTPRGEASSEVPTLAGRRANLAISLSATQQTLLGWIARHPLLPIEHLAAHLALSTSAVATLVNRLVRDELVRVDATPGFGTREGPRHVLTHWGADFLAARDGVPLRRYLDEGPIAAEGREVAAPSVAAPSDVRLLDLRRRPEHTMGVQRFALALTREAGRRRAGGHDHRLLAWLNPEEGQEWFRHDGRVGHVWPDARFGYRASGVVYELLLEWDRGVVRRRDYARKFNAYAAYFNAGPATSDHDPGVPRVVVATPAAATGRVRAEVDRAARRSAGFAMAARVITVDTVRQERISEVLR